MIARFSRKDFLDALFADYYREHRGFTLVKSFKRGDAKMSTRYFPNIDILAKEQYGEDRDVYFGICPRERMKAEKEHVRYIVAFWADLDIGSEGHEEKHKFFEGPREAAKAIRSFPRAPSIIVESGRGAHLYWLLREVTEVSDHEKFESILAKINDFLQCDTEVSLDTVFRLPETMNTKIPARPVNCEVKFINSNFRYAVEDFENLGHRIAVPSPGPAAKQARRAGPPGIPSFSEEEPAKIPFPAASTGGDPSIAESLVLDETIIDELIDDISMTGSGVTGSGVTTASADATPARGYTPEETVPQFETNTVVHRETIESTTPVVSPATPSTSFLEGIFSARTEVEVSLVSSEKIITGVLTWNRNGLIGIESGDDFFTIPLSSISYIKTKIR
ncbi:MAG: hypothetical protein ACLQPD_20050 [Desulfomonilaceae bacterium]